MHGCNQQAGFLGIQVAHDYDIVAHCADLIPAGRHGTLIHAESEGHIGGGAALCLGHWYADHESRREHREGRVNVALHNDSLGLHEEPRLNLLAAKLGSPFWRLRACCN